MRIASIQVQHITRQPLSQPKVGRNVLLLLFGVFLWVVLKSCYGSNSCPDFVGRMSVNMGSLWRTAAQNPIPPPAE